MMFHTLGTILALVAIHTGTVIVIYFVGTICTVFARISVALVDICKRDINGEDVLESVHFFFKRNYTSTSIVTIIDI